MFKGLGRIARHRKETPDLFTGLRVIGSDVSTYAELGAAVTDKDFALGSTRCTGDAVVPLGIDDGVDFPDLLAAARIDGYQATIQCADVNLTLVDRNASIDRATAEASTEVFRHHRIVTPLLNTGFGIHGVNDGKG